MGNHISYAFHDKCGFGHLKLLGMSIYHVIVIDIKCRFICFFVPSLSFFARYFLSAIFCALLLAIHLDIKCDK